MFFRFSRVHMNSTEYLIFCSIFLSQQIQNHPPSLPSQNSFLCKIPAAGSRARFSCVLLEEFLQFLMKTNAQENASTLNTEKGMVRKVIIRQNFKSIITRMINEKWRITVVLKLKPKIKKGRKKINKKEKFGFGGFYFILFFFVQFLSGTEFAGSCEAVKLINYSK